MSSNFLNSRDGPAQSNVRPELIRTHADMLAAEADAKAAKRRIDLEELRSDLKTPEERIRAWERVHGLALPLDPDHPIVDLIAAKTHLTKQDVQTVQRNYAARRVARLGPREP